MVAGHFICVPNRSLKSSFLSSDYRCSQGVLIDHVVGEAVATNVRNRKGRATWNRRCFLKTRKSESYDMWYGPAKGTGCKNATTGFNTSSRVVASVTTILMGG